jgi:hypothetical protein
MKRSFWPVMAFAFALATAARADITYNISRTAGTASINGSIQTDGATGTLAGTDILDWNLVLTNGPAILNLTGPLSGGNSVDLDSVLMGDLTASSSDLFFNFGAANDGHLLFQTTGLFGTGEQYYCVGASLLNSPCAAGEDIVPVSIFDATTYAHSGALTGNEVIASVPAAVPEPTTGLLLTTMLLGVGFAARRRIARG